MNKAQKILSLLLALCILVSLTAFAQEAHTAEFDDSADLIIVGAGTAGLSAAMRAVEVGAQKVILVEKMGFFGGCLNTTTGNTSAAVTKIQQEEGFTEDSFEKYKEDILLEGSREGGKPNEALVDLYVQNAGITWDWLWDKGLKDYEFIRDEEGKISRWNVGHNLFNYRRAYDPLASEGSSFTSGIGEFVVRTFEQTPGIVVYLNTNAQHLITNENGQVVGVEALNTVDGTTVRYTSKHGVLMATGGYASNRKLIEHFNQNVSNTLSFSMASSDGYGLYMMEEVGGTLTDYLMTWYAGHPCGIEDPTTPGRGYAVHPNVFYTGGIIVNNRGERYMDETAEDVVIHELGIFEQPDTVEYHIWTDAIQEDLLKTPYGDAFRSFFIDGAGAQFVKSASSIEELAQKFGIDAAGLQKTVADYNTCVDTQTPDAFGREFVTNVNLDELKIDVDDSGRSQRLATNVLSVNKIEAETYYGIEIKPLLVMTMGGISVNDSMQVLDASDNAIPGLYAAGEVVGNMWGTFVSSGCGVVGALTFGRVAAENMMTLPMADNYTIAPNKDLLDVTLFSNDAAAEHFDMSVELKDGVYVASMMGQNGIMELQTTIADGKIADVTILSHNETPGISDPAIAQMPQRIMEAGSVNVDGVSGASLSSGRIIELVTECLEQAA